MIQIINPTRLTRQPFFKDLINFLDQHDDVILRQIKAQFPDQPVDKLMEEYIKAGFILRENKRYTLNLPSWSQLIEWTWIKRSLSERTVQFIKN